jgi:hypothetical protein
LPQDYKKMNFPHYEGARKKSSQHYEFFFWTSYIMKQNLNFPH